VPTRRHIAGPLRAGYLCLIAMLIGCGAYGAEDTDDLALPVRKNGSSATNSSSKARKSDSDAEKSDASERSGKSSGKSADRDTKSSAKSKNSEKTEENESSTKRKTDTSESKSKSSSASTKSAKTTSKKKTETASSDDSEKKPSTKTAKSSSKSDTSKETGNSKSSSKKTGDDEEDAALASLPTRKSKSTRSTESKSKSTGDDADSDEKPRKSRDMSTAVSPNTYSDPEHHAAPNAGAEAELPVPVLSRGDKQEFPAESASLPPPQSASASMPLPDPPAPKTGFLARLMGRRSSPTSNAAAPVPFNTDYATRAAGAVIPAVLTGMGWGGVDLPIGAEDQYRLATLPADFRPTDLVLLPKDYCYYGNAIYMRREAALSMMRMCDDAAREGHALRVFSGYRDYSHQLRLYTQAVRRSGPNQKGVARPGKSEHQLGTTADVTDGPRSVLSRSFADTPTGRWLAANCSKYGWKMTVLRGNGPRSHADEPWHIRYLSTSNAAGTGTQVAGTTQRFSVMRGLGKLVGLGRNNP